MKQIGCLKPSQSCCCSEVDLWVWSDSMCAVWVRAASLPTQQHAARTAAPRRRPVLRAPSLWAAWLSRSWAPSLCPAGSSSGWGPPPLLRAACWETVEGGKQADPVRVVHCCPLEAVTPQAPYAWLGGKAVLGPSVSTPHCRFHLWPLTVIVSCAVSEGGSPTVLLTSGGGPAEAFPGVTPQGTFSFVRKGGVQKNA